MQMYKIMHTLIQLMLLVIVYPSYIYSNVKMVILLSMISVIIYILYFKIKYKTIHYYNIEFNIPILFYIYNMSYPILMQFFNAFDTLLMRTTEYSIYKGIAISAATSIILNLLVVIFYKENGQLFRFINKELKKILLDIKLNPRFLIIDCIAIFCVLQMVIQINKSGGISTLFNISNRTIKSTIIGQNFILKYFFISYTCYIILAVVNQIKRTNLITTLNRNIHRFGFIIFYYFVNIVGGNRREILYVLIFILIYIIFSNDKFKLTNIQKIICIVGIIILLCFGYFRNFANSNYEFNQELFIKDTFGEVIYPIQTLYYYVENMKELPYLSYFNAIILLIPRSIWNNKPESLAVNFMEDLGTTMGYAFTPLTEAYLNFGILCIIILPIIIIIIMNLIKFYSRRNCIIYFLAFIQLFNFNRGEVSTIFIEMLIMIISYYLMDIINNFHKRI